MRDWQGRANELSAAAYARGQVTDWFDRLYAEGAAGTTAMPWERDAPHPALAEWANRESVDGSGRRAIVLGCGLGADAEYVAGRGFATTGIDLAPHAIEQARLRHPGSVVDYQVADLRDLPSRWRQAFDLVVEIFTLQAVPDPPRAEMAAAARSLLAPSGTLLLVGFRFDGSAPADQGPPFPLTEDFVIEMATDGLEIVEQEELVGPLWRVSYRR